MSGHRSMHNIAEARVRKRDAHDTHSAGRQSENHPEFTSLTTNSGNAYVA